MLILLKSFILKISIVKLWKHRIGKSFSVETFIIIIFKLNLSSVLLFENKKIEIKLRKQNKSN